MLIIAKRNSVPFDTDFLKMRKNELVHSAYINYKVGIQWRSEIIFFFRGVVSLIWPTVFFFFVKESSYLYNDLAD